MQDLKLPVQGTGFRRHRRFGATAFPTPDRGAVPPFPDSTTHTGCC